jgi:hypothetical protein
MEIVDFMRKTERRLLDAGVDPILCPGLVGRISDDALIYAEHFATSIAKETISGLRPVRR